MELWQRRFVDMEFHDSGEYDRSGHGAWQQDRDALRRNIYAKGRGDAVTRGLVLVQNEGREC